LTLSSLDINRIPRHRARYAVLKVPEGVIENPEDPGLGETPSRLNSVPTGLLPSRSDSSELPHPTEPEGLFVPSLLELRNTVNSQQINLELGLGCDRPIRQSLLRKEVIQPHVPVRLPCYDFVLIADPTFGSSLPKRVGPLTSGVADSHDVTGGVYNPRERIHRGFADPRLLATPTSWSRVADSNPN
jgi:hypothetical protein